MHRALITLLLVFNLHTTKAHPVNNGFNTDVDMLKVLLDRMLEPLSEQTAVGQIDPAQNEEVDRPVLEETMDEQQQRGLDVSKIREFLSAKNLKTVRNDSSKRSSGCFGRRMDRIGSMSSLGCNTVGKDNPK